MQHGKGLDEFNFMVSFVCGSELQSNGMLPRPEGVNLKSCQDHARAAGQDTCDIPALHEV